MSTTALQAPSRPARLGHSFSPRLFLSELLLKQWFEPVIPFTVMILLALYFSLTVKDYGTLANALSLMRLFAEFGFVALGMGFSLISGGIDLSVGAIFAFCNFTALFCLFVLGLPVGLVIVVTLLVGAAIGACNGILIGYLKARPRRRQSVERTLRDGIRHKFGGQRRLGFSRRRQCARNPHQCRDTDRCPVDRPYFSKPVALWLAPHGHRREP